MTSAYLTNNNHSDDFFDFPDNDDATQDGPNLRGEYNRGDTPPSARTVTLTKSTHQPSAGSSTSGHFSSEESSSMPKAKRASSRKDLDTRSTSRSPARSDSNRYSDSFDSEDSGGDSRSGSPTTTRRGSSRKAGSYYASSKRFDSGTSRDSTATFRSTKSSGYGKPHKKGFQKSPPKNKGRGRSSNATTSSPRGNVNETTKRMLSAKGHTINRIRNEYEVLKSNHDELQREFKLQKELHRKNTRELEKYTNQEEQLPTLLKSQSTELEHYRKKVQGYREKERQKDQQMKQYVGKLNKTEDELKEAQQLLENKGLKERADLQKERDDLQERLQDLERKMEDVDRYVKNMKKNQKHERRDWMHTQKDYKGQIERLHMDNEKLSLQLREKEKELEIKNIYSNRMAKAPATLTPGRLSMNTSQSPSALRPITLHKSTTTDDIVLNSSPRRPHAPADTPKRASSAEERVQHEDTKARTTKSPRDERNRRRAEEQREKERKEKEDAAAKKDLSEHERILMELDSGFTKSEESSSKGNKKEDEEEDESMRILRQFDDNSTIKGNSSSRKEQQDEAERRRREEAERRRREEAERKRREEEQEEERRRLEEEERRRKEEEAKKQQENKQKEQDAKLSPRKTPTLNVSDEEEDYPMFGSKAPVAAATKPSKIPFAVNSVRGLQNYTTASRDSPSPAAGVGAKKTTAGGEYSGLFAESEPAAVKNDKSSQEQAAKEAEERRKKDELLAKMRQIDDGGKPDSGRSRKSYSHTDPVKNMHNGLPSHPDGTNKPRKNSSDDDLTFGSYAPSFTVSGGPKTASNKSTPKKKNPFFDNDDASDGGFGGSPKQSPKRVAAGAKKTNLMADLFGTGSSDKSDNPSSNSEKSDFPSRSSFGEDNIFSSTTKAKPLADTGSYPWEKKVTASEGNNNNKPPVQNGGGGAFGGQKSSGRGVTSFSDDFDDDLEEMTL